MKKKVVMSPDQMPDKEISLKVIAKYIHQRQEIDEQFLRGLAEQGRGLTSDDLQMLIEHKHRPLMPCNKPKDDEWIIPIISAEHQILHDFFGQEFDLSEFAKKLKEIGPEKIAWWKKNLLEVHYLPPFVFQQGVKLPCIEVAIPDNYYQYLANGNVFRDVNRELVKITEARLDGIVVLIDTRLKPAYDGGKQMWKRDGLVGGAVKKLRKYGKINNYDLQNSRFNVSADEISEISKSVAIALKVGTCRLETTTERIIIPQLYRHIPRKDDGKTNTSVWCDEFFGSRRDRFDGGSSDCGGLAGVSADGASYRWGGSSFRFLAVL